MLYAINHNVPEIDKCGSSYSNFPIFIMRDETDLQTTGKNLLIPSYKHIHCIHYVLHWAQINSSCPMFTIAWVNSSISLWVQLQWQFSIECLVCTNTWQSVLLGYPRVFFECSNLISRMLTGHKLTRLVLSRSGGVAWLKAVMSCPLYI